MYAQIVYPNGGPYSIFGIDATQHLVYPDQATGVISYYADQRPASSTDAADMDVIFFDGPNNVGADL